LPNSQTKRRCRLPFLNPAGSCKDKNPRRDVADGWTAEALLLPDDPSASLAASPDANGKIQSCSIPTNR
jgi:hypothetical protein